MRVLTVLEQFWFISQFVTKAKLLLKSLFHYIRDTEWSRNSLSYFSIGHYSRIHRRGKAEIKIDRVLWNIYFLVSVYMNSSIGMMRHHWQKLQSCSCVSYKVHVTSKQQQKHLNWSDILSWNLITLYSPVASKYTASFTVTLNTIFCPQNDCSCSIILITNSHY
jgi:hypothetical protein